MLTLEIVQHTTWFCRQLEKHVVLKFCTPFLLFMFPSTTKVPVTSRARRRKLPVYGVCIPTEVRTSWVLPVSGATRPSRRQGCRWRHVPSDDVTTMTSQGCRWLPWRREARRTVRRTRRWSRRDAVGEQCDGHGGEVDATQWVMDAHVTSIWVVDDDLQHTQQCAYQHVPLTSLTLLLTVSLTHLLTYLLI